jgi:hypothetical protein
MSKNSFKIDFSQIFRGETPEDIEHKCFDLCQKYLGGVWLRVSIDEIEVKRLSGGFTNQLYYCAINKNIKPIGDEPQEVAILIYGRKHVLSPGCVGNERLTDVVIALLVSEYKLGPKIYGLFENGQIQSFYKVLVLFCLIYSEVLEKINFLSIISDNNPNYNLIINNKLHIMSL